MMSKSVLAKKLVKRVQHHKARTNLAQTSEEIENKYVLQFQTRERELSISATLALNEMIFFP